MKNETPNSLPDIREAPDADHADQGEPTGAEPTGGGEHPFGHDKSDDKDKKRLTPPKKIAIAAVLAALAAGGGWFWYQQHVYESTDDAYVRANSTQLAPEVSGIITHVLVDENDVVKAGQILAQIDPKDYRAALASAEYELGSIRARLASARDDFGRAQKLVKSGAITIQAFDHAKSAFEELARRERASRARADQARLNLEYTSLRAPSDGQIARKSVQIGMYAGAGVARFGFVPTDERWVDAYYKETQLEKIVPGRPARVTIDALSGREFRGVVESIAPATGATFTLLPPDNATGNFTKIVQRVPVRIRLRDLTEEDRRELHAGLSAVVDILKQEEPQKLPARPQPVYLAEDIRAPAPPLTPGYREQSQAAGVAASKRPLVLAPEPEPEPERTLPLPPQAPALMPAPAAQ
jgi:membrane fusion protein (multidrug efflux system)